ncbi:hypothetical protein JVT61DRAFT_12 [Boletus reticuloceps]|uniref:Uncharacterized protein n=1 Tax=Boletus reticuloceps TaxID=495285 RepID=A0A8I2Z108_9AGAM|nr:hypothetical protein JVT61DRAFT_12 [Boletus reticuloceps]
MEGLAEINHLLCSPCSEGPLHRSGVEERPVKEEESIGNKALNNVGKRRVIKLLPEENVMTCGEVLNWLGLCLHAKLLVLICQQCEVGVCAEAALGHAKNQPSITTSRGEKKVFQGFCEEHGVCHWPEQAPIPLAGGPPVRGIAALVPGYSCRADPLNCSYSVHNFQTLLKHARLQHGQGLAHNMNRE